MRIFFAFFLLSLLYSCQNEPTVIVENQEGLISLNNTELYCKVVGEGEPLVVIHGGPGLSHDYFLPQMEGLAEDYTLIFYDQRVSGRSASDLDTTEVSLEKFLEDIEAIRRHFKLGKMNLMGHSWGGLLAIQYAKTYPDSLKHLILSNSTPASSELRASESAKLSERITEEDKAERAKIISTDAFKEGNARAYEKFFKWFYKKEFANEALADNLNLAFPTNFVQNNQLLQYLGKDMGQYDYHNDLKKINTPTLVIYGDYESGLEGGKLIHENLPNSEFVLIKNSGHFPFIEQPEAYFDAIDDFLD